MVAPRLLEGMRVIPGRLDRRDERLDRHGLIALHRRLLRREVDRRLDAVELVELALDAGDARRARHPLEVEANLFPRCLGRGHAASYPASTIAARSAASSSSCPVTVTSFESRSTATSSTPATSETSSRIDSSQCAQWIAGTV